MANGRREAPLEATEAPKEPGSGTCNTVGVSDLCPGTTAMPTSDSPMGVSQENIMGQARPTNEALEDSDLDFSLPKRFPKPNFPELNFPEPNFPEPNLLELNSLEPNSSTGSPMLERYRRYIEGLGEPLYKQFTSVGEPFLHCLEDAERPSGGARAKLARLTRIAREELSQKISDDLKVDDPDLERTTEREDGSGDEYSRNLLECVRRVIVVEAIIRRSSNKRSQAGNNRRKMARESPPGGSLGIREVSSKEISLDIDSDFEGGDPKDEPVAVPEDKEQKKRRNQEKKQDGGNVLLQYCNDTAR